MIAQPYPDIRDRFDGVLLVGEAVAGLNAYSPPTGFDGFLVDGG